MSNGARALRATATVLVDGRREGSAVPVDGRHLLTAAHVLPRGESLQTVTIEVEFPAVERPDAQPAKARVPVGTPLDVLDQFVPVNQLVLSPDGALYVAAGVAICTYAS